MVVLLTLCAAAAPGCGGSDAPADELVAELDALARGPNRAFAIFSTLASAGTLLLSEPDDNLLNSINLHITNESAGCAMVSQAPGTLTATFPDTGCALATGSVTVSGTMNVTIARDGSTVRVLDKIDLTVSNEKLTGELVLITTDGNTFTYQTLAALGGYTFNIPLLSGTPINAVTDVNLMGGTEPVGMAMRNINYNSVQQRFTACHAHEGSIELVSPSENIDRTLTYEDDTPQTGTATYVENGNTYQVSLPNVASCPPAPTSVDTGM